MRNVDYKMVTVADEGLSSTDAVNKFTSSNPEWTLFNTVPIGSKLAFIFTRPKKEAPSDGTPGGALKDPALLTESSVIPFRRAA